MGWNIFKSNKSDDEKSLLREIEESLSTKKREKRQIEKEIKEIKNWISDAIIDAYSDFFPNSNLTYYRKQYAETALEEYEKIKAKFGPQMSKDEVLKCDEIVNSYLEQIKIRKNKLKLLEKLEAEYLETKEKLKTAKFQEAETVKKLSKEERLKAHAQKLKTLEETSKKKIEEIEKESHKLEDIKQEAVYHEEYHKELNRLNNMFKKEKDLPDKDDIFELDEQTEDLKTNSKPSFKDEIDDILNSLDSNK